LMFSCRWFPSYDTSPYRHSFPTRRSSDLGKAGDFQAPVVERQHALKFLSIGNPMANRSLLYELLSTGQPLEIQKESLKILGEHEDRKSTRLNSSHVKISYAVFCLKKKRKI